MNAKERARGRVFLEAICREANRRNPDRILSIASPEAVEADLRLPPDERRLIDPKEVWYGTKAWKQMQKGAA